MSKPSILSKFKKILNSLYSAESVAVGTIAIQTKDETTQGAMRRELEHVSRQQESLTQEDIDNAPEPSELNEEMDRLRRLEDARIQQVTGESYEDTQRVIETETVSVEGYLTLQATYRKLLDNRVHTAFESYGLPTKRTSLLVREAVKVFSDYGYKPNFTVKAAMESYEDKHDTDVAMEGLIDWVKNKLKDYRENKWKKILEENKLNTKLMKQYREVEVPEKIFAPLGKYFSARNRRHGDGDIQAILTYLTEMGEATKKIAQLEIDGLNMTAPVLPNFTAENFDIEKFNKVVSDILQHQETVISKDLNMLGLHKNSDVMGIYLPFYYEKDKEGRFVLNPIPDKEKGKERDFNFHTNDKVKVGNLVPTIEKVYDASTEVVKLVGTTQWYQANVISNHLAIFRREKSPYTAEVEKGVAIIDLSAEIVLGHYDSTLSAFNAILNKAIYDAVGKA